MNSGSRRSGRDANPAASASSPGNIRQRAQALALMFGRLSVLTNNPSSSAPLSIDTSLDGKLKIEEESPTAATTTTASLSTIASETRLAMAGKTSPQFASALLSPSFQLPSPTEDTPKNAFEVTFADKFSNMFDTDDDDTALNVIVEEEEKDTAGGASLEEPPNEEINQQNGTEGFPSEDRSVQSHTTEKTYASKISRFSINEAVLNSPRQEDEYLDNRYDDDSHQSVEANGILENDSQHSRNINDSPASKVSYLSMAELDSPIRGNHENLSPTYPKRHRLSMTGAIQALDESTIDPDSDPFLGIRQVEFKMPDRKGRPPPIPSIESDSDPFRHVRQGGYQVPDRKGRPPPFPSILRKSYHDDSLIEKNAMHSEKTVPCNKDWDDECLDRIELFRYGNEILSHQSQGRPPALPDGKNDCWRYKTFQTVCERLKQSSPDMDWDYGLDPVIADRIGDDHPVQIASTFTQSPRDDRPSVIPDRQIACSRQEALQHVHLRLQQSSPDVDGWDQESEEEIIEQHSDDEQSIEEIQEEAPSSISIDHGITLRTIRESRLDKYSDELDNTCNEYYYDDYQCRNDDDESTTQDTNHLSYYHEHFMPPMVPKALASTTRWYRKTGALPQASYQTSGPVDFDQMYDSIYQNPKSPQVMSDTPQSDTVYLLWKQRGQPVGVFLRKLKRHHGIYVDRLDPNGLAYRADTEAAHHRSSQRAIVSASNRKKRFGRGSRSSFVSNETSSTPSSRTRSVGRLAPGMKIEMINSQPCPNDLQVCIDIIVQTSGWLTLHV
ncbi:MAG: hypothetical protein SGBAC_011937, partial [Bacillariaceae sp.]